MNTKIISYSPQYKEDFIRLNKAWLEKYFYVEPHDLETFNTIESDIINNGGEIFFCIIDDKPVGTVAVIKVNDKLYELAKMAVDENYQGLKLSNLLMEASIDFVKKQNAEKLFLVSNRILKTALHLYLKYNFVEVPMDETDYDRADIQMELIL
ncbi:GNAT family N-acetyltransferase [Flavobacterium urocaniciphilum]|uniref:Acetyltransferase (GNAT) domain-containing protein n=1 Tax=Flavobacterium urocaniciphilum TaxID=1299341 RepID=A0A1H8ZCS9_9FLAO|nr:GNAT family N-acetyltransferase [Flavobacterium urocaniciphilum]SEP61967.1 Acetyltransferase (GNAT) domain-containing protein [Flavobacterium urocaniciphilum]